MKILTVNEEILLITVWQLKENAYGFPIMKKVMEITKKKISYGSLYNSLNNLAIKGYLTFYKGEPTEERGGKRKVYYTITPQGITELQNAMRFHMNLWANAPDLVSD
ncbi:MAG: PadR family transcriptional regulator [Candidatus Aminicenantes bacterium]|nr:MAG: PadR family transcriptional regulator [Candidatus Aminicenantes bacterium]